TIVRMDGDAQVSLKLIETQSTRILATVSETFAAGTSMAQVAERVAVKLTAKLAELYPLRGKVVQSSKQRVQLNIGSALGVREGNAFVYTGTGAAAKVVAVEPATAWLELAAGQKAEKGAKAQRAP